MKFLRYKEKKENAIQPARGEDSVSQNAEIARLRQAIEQRRRHYRSANKVGIMALSVELLTVPLLFQITVPSNNPIMPLVVWASSSLSIGALSFLYTWRGKKELEQAITAIADSTNRDAIGPLIEMVEFYGPYNAFGTGGSDYKAYQAAVQALTRLLPHTSAEDSFQIRAQQCRRLPRVLLYAATSRSKRRYNIPFALAILTVLEQIGDGSAIPYVERLAQMTPRDEDQRLLQASAETCLARLRERSQEVEQQSSLLRASDAIPTDTLLRAVTGTSPTDPMQLLRAGQEDNR